MWYFFPDTFFQLKKKIVGSAVRVVFFPTAFEYQSCMWHCSMGYIPFAEKLYGLHSQSCHRKGMVASSSGLIQSYAHKFKELFGWEFLIPKHNFLLHYSALIEKFGPLRNMWCMKYEAKHRYFKKLIVNTRNFINVTHTSTERHQMKLSHALASTKLVSRRSKPQ